MKDLIHAAQHVVAAAADWLREALAVQTEHQARLAYVSEAKDRIDLELRQREIDRSQRFLSSHPASTRSGW